MAVVVTAAARVTIAPRARGQLVLAMGSLGGVTSATYHSCAHRLNGFFAQGFAFTRRPFHGCVPLDVTIDNQTAVHRVTVSLLAGNCAGAGVSSLNHGAPWRCAWRLPRPGA